MNVNSKGIVKCGAFTGFEYVLTEKMDELWKANINIFGKILNTWITEDELTGGKLLEFIEELSIKEIFELKDIINKKIEEMKK